MVGQVAGVQNSIKVLPDGQTDRLPQATAAESGVDKSWRNEEAGPGRTLFPDGAFFLGLKAKEKKIVRDIKSSHASANLLPRAKKLIFYSKPPPAHGEDQAEAESMTKTKGILCWEGEVGYVHRCTDMVTVVDSERGREEVERGTERRQAGSQAGDDGVRRLVRGANPSPAGAALAGKPLLPVADRAAVGCVGRLVLMALSYLSLFVPTDNGASSASSTAPIMRGSANQPSWMAVAMFTLTCDLPFNSRSPLGSSSCPGDSIPLFLPGQRKALNLVVVGSSPTLTAEYIV
nr:unnamed protein product [Digitaria exilis]